MKSVEVDYLVIRVVNLLKEDYDIYIGRAGKGQSGYFGNPYRVDQDGTREEVIALFKEHFEWRIAHDSTYHQRVHSLQGKVLGCFCKPDSCHGDIYVEHLTVCKEKFFD